MLSMIVCVSVVCIAYIGSVAAAAVCCMSSKFGKDFNSNMMKALEQ